MLTTTHDSNLIEFLATENIVAALPHLVLISPSPLNTKKIFAYWNNQWKLTGRSPKLQQAIRGQVPQPHWVTDPPQVPTKARREPLLYVDDHFELHVGAVGAKAPTAAGRPGSSEDVRVFVPSHSSNRETPADGSNPASPVPKMGVRNFQADPLPSTDPWGTFFARRDQPPPPPPPWDPPTHDPTVPPPLLSTTVLPPFDGPDQNPSPPPAPLVPQPMRSWPGAVHPHPGFAKKPPPPRRGQPMDKAA